MTSSSVKFLADGSLLDILPNTNPSTHLRESMAPTAKIDVFATASLQLGADIPREKNLLQIGGALVTSAAACMLSPTAGLLPHGPLRPPPRTARSWRTRLRGRRAAAWGAWVALARSWGRGCGGSRPLAHPWLLAFGMAFDFGKRTRCAWRSGIGKGQNHHTEIDG